MFRSYEVSSVNTIFWSFVVAILYAHDWRLAMLTTIGVGLAVVFNPLTSYFTSTKRRAGQGDRQIDQDRPGDHHPLRPLGGYGIERVGAGGHRDQLSSALLLLYGARRPPVRAVWGGHDRYRHAQPYRQ